MDKINYNQHDWNKGEVIKENNLDNMENGIKQATDKINEIIDTEQDFKDRMADIDRRIDINNEELVIARDGCDNLGQRIERDQQYIYNILNDGSYLEFTGTDVTVDNAKEGYTKDTIIKGQTYQNLIIGDVFNHDKLKEVKWIQTSKPLQTNQLYTFQIRVLENTLDTPFLVSGWNLAGGSADSVKMEDSTIPGDIEIFTAKEVGIKKFTFGFKSLGKPDSKIELSFFNQNQDKATGSVKFELVLFEGNWLNKKIPENVTNIESVGEKENNKISILSHGANMINPKNCRDGFFYNSGIIQSKPNESYPCAKLSVEEGKTYYFTSIPMHMCYANKDGSFLDGVPNIKEKDNARYFTATHTSELFIRPEIPYEQGLEYKNLHEFLNNFMFNEGNSLLAYVPHKQDKKEILLSLDGGLKSLSDGTCDTIEQRDDGVYLVQRVSKRILNGSESWAHNNATPNQNNTLCFNSNVIPSGNVLISDKFSFLNVSDFDASDYECITSGTSGPYGLMIRINKNVLNQQGVNGFKEWLQANPTTIYYKLETPVETKLDIDTLNLETFKDLTYVTSNNSIKPTLSFKAPVDINQTIADLQEEQEQLMETYNTLKDENKAVRMAISGLNEQEDVQTADMLDLDMRVLALEEGLE